MKRFLLFFSLYIFGVIVSFGQNYFGLLKDKQGEKLPYISVVLKNSEDSSFVSGHGIRRKWFFHYKKTSAPKMLFAVFWDWLL